MRDRVQRIQRIRRVAISHEITPWASWPHRAVPEPCQKTSALERVPQRGFLMFSHELISAL